MNLNDKNILEKILKKLNINPNIFLSEIENLEIKDKLKTKTSDAYNNGIFGTPTFVFENGNSIYLKTFIPTEQNAIKSFEHFLSISKDCSFIGEMKRPQPPWPSGYDV